MGGASPSPASAPAPAAAPAAAPAPAPAPAPVALTRAVYIDAVVRLLQSPAGATVADLEALPLPADVNDAATANKLRVDGRTLFRRRMCACERDAFRYLAQHPPQDGLPSDQVVGALSFVLRSSERTPAMVAFGRSKGDERRRQCVVVRDVLRATPGWLAAVRACHVFFHTGRLEGVEGGAEMEEEPPVAVLEAWALIAFDRREDAREAMRHRRALVLLRRRGERLLAHAPAPGHPTTADVETYWSYLAQLTTDANMSTMFTFTEHHARTALMQTLRAAFPDWVPRRADGRAIERCTRAGLDAMQALLSGEDGGIFEFRVLDYLRNSLDTYEDRIVALGALTATYKARITPAMAWAVIEAATVGDAALADRVFPAFLTQTWMPAVQPDRDAIVTGATELARLPHGRALGLFAATASPRLLQWPCAADTAFVRSLLLLHPDGATRASIFVTFVSIRIPDGASHMSYQDFNRFVAPLLRCIPDGTHRCNALYSLIESWSRPVTDAAARGMLRMSTQPAWRIAIFDAIHSQRTRALAMQARRALAAERQDGRIRDVAAAADGASPDTTCVVCMFNLRRVCFVPCGHIVACIECAAQCDSTCPMCRSAFTHAQPCLVPV